MIITITGCCQFKDCEKDATRIATGREYFEGAGHSLGCYCEKHASIVVEEGFPEYIEQCPNCGCRFGVNQ